MPKTNAGESGGYSAVESKGDSSQAILIGKLSQTQSKLQQLQDEQFRFTNTKSNGSAAAGGYALTQGKETDEDDIKRKR